MNNENRSPRKEVIKNIAIVFLAVLLVLTFFSNTFMNYTLPQVSAVYVSQGTISEQIRGSGTVEAAESYEVKFDQTRTIKSVAVKTGQTINAGDTLFELEDSDSDELTQAQKDLEDKELDYKKAVLAQSDSSKYQSDYLEIQKAEKELSELQAKYQAALAGTDPLSSALNDYNSLKSRSDKLTKEKEDLNNQLSAVNADTSDDMINLTGAYYDTLRADKDLVTELEKKVETAQSDYDELSKDVGADTDYASKIEETRKSIESATVELNQLYISLYNAKADDDTTSISASIATKSLEIDQLQRDLSNYLAKSTTSGVLKTKLKNAESTLNKAKKNLNSAKDTLSNDVRSIKLEIKAKLDKVTAELDDVTLKLTNAGTAKDDATAAGYLSASQLELKISEQKDTVDNLYAALEIKKQTDSVTNESNQLDLEAKKKDIERQKEKVEKLKSEAFDAVVTAKMGGTVESVSVTAGSEVAAGTVAAVISVSDLGYTVSFSVKNDQAKKVKVGDKAEITSWYWGDSFSATLSEVKTDTANPQTQKTLVFNVTGSDISTGQTITLSMGSKGQPYSAVVPNAAVREDSNGKFVLVMEAKSSPLGNRYKAVRYDIEVLAKDDNNTAVNGLMGSEYVITTSTKPIQAGDQVRPAES
ncbi:biotin/lipoyl-binding protein [Huintestinicola sp.]|uniref:biotin/lipoyl-binding protein n=1 Tax=Huintestinicola sp. TaxID=2981661 RepID=UPI00307B70B1